MVSESGIRCSGGRQHFAAIIPVGPDTADLSRGLALIATLVQWEPNVDCCVIVDDAPRPRGLSELTLFPERCRATTLIHPCQGRGSGTRGRLVAAVLSALSWIHANTDSSFVLKIDTDALVIGPFANSIYDFLARTADAGLVGSLGLSCNPYVRPLDDLRREAQLVAAYRLFPKAPPLEDSEAVELVDVPRLGRVPAGTLRAFDAVRPHIKAAIDNGFASSEFCQGGAYAITRLMIDRMASAGYLTCPTAWGGLHFHEDRTMAMYARAVGLQVCDYARPGEPFGTQGHALPYPLEELGELGYSLIHSVKNDPRYSEMEIRRFFHERSAARSSNA